MEHNPHDFHASQTQYEQLVRTYWVCFAQDCELSSGARQHFALSFSNISVPLPISDRDFTFNQVPERRLMPADMNKNCSLAGNFTIEHGLTIVTRGFDIFVRILRFANEHRRALASLTSDDSETSPLHQIWQKLREELEEWRSLQDKTVQYPDTPVQAQVSLGYGELFAYINLLYFMRYASSRDTKPQVILTLSQVYYFCIVTASFQTSNLTLMFFMTRRTMTNISLTPSSSFSRPRRGLAECSRRSKLRKLLL